ncbi:MAG: glycoside hydrolase family 3 N-terminal domain-containing protein [Bacilli bacterium]
MFGWASSSVFYGGSGSGTSNSLSALGLPEALKKKGIECNPSLVSKYEEFQSSRKASGVGSADWSLPEPAIDTYSDADFSSYLAYSDTAMMVISRNGGEGNDLPKGYLTITENERNLLDKIKTKFEKVIVLINTGNAMELGFLDDEKIDAAVNIGFPGSQGLEGVASVIKGEVSPSGRLVDTYAYDSTSAPSYFESAVDNNTLGVFQYSNKAGYYYVDYNEGIYVGYRYYETRYSSDSPSHDEGIDYSSVVQYPFDYGLSYTTFDYEFVSSSPERNSDVTVDSTLSVKVKVTNTGDFKGKDVVSLYYTAPYISGQIEKSYVTLGSFEKTKELAPKESQILEFTISMEDMASYDSNDMNRDGFCGYTLDKGTYSLRLSKNSHERLKDDSAFTVDYNLKTSANIIRRSNDKTDVTNQYTGETAENGISVDGSQEKTKVEYVSRLDFEGTLPQKKSREMTSKVSSLINYKTVDDKDDEMPTVSEDSGLVLKDMEGLEYSDPKWETLLNQLSVKEMKELIGKAGYLTARIPSIEKNKTIDLDGPAGINESNTTIGTDTSHAVAYPCETVIAQTFNKDVAYSMGYAVGKEADAYGINGWYAPAMNLHRSPYSGRNFEYYSEDPYLSGVMGSNVSKGAKDMGLYTYVKHFAVNDQETKRDANGIYTWLTEQSMRELYLKPFEMTVKDGSATAFMSSFNRIGATWAGGSHSLLTTILRNEWGYRGMVITDWYYPGNYMNIDQGLRAGNDCWLNGLGLDVTFDSSSSTSVKKMRESSHHILYTIANATIVSKEADNTWVIYVYVIDAILVAELGFYLTMTIFGYKKKLKSESNKNDLKQGE